MLLHHLRGSSSNRSDNTRMSNVINPRRLFLSASLVVRPQEPEPPKGSKSDSDDSIANVVSEDVETAKEAQNEPESSRQAL